MPKPQAKAKYDLVLIRFDMDAEGLSGVDVATKAGIARGTVYGVLAGKTSPHPGTMKKIADAIGQPLRRYLLRQAQAAAAATGGAVPPKGQESAADPPGAAQQVA
jgi:transcriptional regulator with XRE-family HTH domain